MAIIVPLVPFKSAMRVVSSVRETHSRSSPIIVIASDGNVFIMVIKS